MKKFTFTVQLGKENMQPTKKREVHVIIIGGRDTQLGGLKPQQKELKAGSGVQMRSKDMHVSCKDIYGHMPRSKELRYLPFEYNFKTLGVIFNILIFLYDYCYLPGKL